MKTDTSSLLCAVSLLAACAAPATLATANAQQDACDAAERRGQFGEAELACVQALRSAEQAGATEEAAQPRSDARVGRRMVELASILAAQGKWQEGTGYLERVLPLLPKLSPASRTYSAQVLRQSAMQLQGDPQAAVGARFEAVAASLQ